MEAPQEWSFGLVELGLMLELEHSQLKLELQMAAMEHPSLHVLDMPAPFLLLLIFPLVFPLVLWV